jgi:lipoprotein Spr
MKNLFSWAILASTLASCQALKPAAQKKPEQGQTSRFLEDITVYTGPGSYSARAKEEQMPDLQDEFAPKVHVNSSFNIEQSLGTQFKFAILLDVEIEKLANRELYQYIADWWGTPYKMGGNSKSGIDCSAFVQGLYASVYGISIPRVAREQQAVSQILARESLSEGDMVFFNTRGGVSHVGVYLHNNKFVHAATSGGILISNLDDPYWNRRYLGAGRTVGVAAIPGTLSNQ